MSLKEQLDVDIKRFFEQIENQSQNDKVETLRNLFDKYLHLSTCDYMMDGYDLHSIISNAKGKFASDKMPIFLGEKKTRVSANELPNLMIIESTISHLKKQDCLKKLPKFDKK